MILILSPAKNLDFTSKLPTKRFTLPDHLDRSKRLVNALRKYSRKELEDLMGISSQLADLNFKRYKVWHTGFTPENARQAILAFNGEVYNGLKAKNLDEDTLVYAQQHLRILSGLHGILRPLDLIQPYRLEMGTQLPVGKAANLYEFWGSRINKHLTELAKHTNSKVLINLASHEYAKAAAPDSLPIRVIAPAFKQLKGDKLSTITVYMKKARGLMARYILENRTEDPEQLKLFDAEGYSYAEQYSTRDTWVFVR